MIWSRMIYHGEDLGDYYLISDAGEIKSTKTGVVRKQNKTKYGYCRCVISCGSRNSKICVRVHRAVAETFIENPHNKPQVNHKDGDKSNNCASNLEWVSAKENRHHAIMNGLDHPSYGEEHCRAKLTDKTVEWARRVYTPGDEKYGLRPLARALGIVHSGLYSAIVGDTWNRSKSEI